MPTGRPKVGKVVLPPGEYLHCSSMNIPSFITSPFSPCGAEAAQDSTAGSFAVCCTSFFVSIYEVE
jgi:hypothetical protein